MKNNLFNKIFRRKKLSEYLRKVDKSKTLVGWYPHLEQRLKEATSLGQLLAIHKDAWNLGFQNPNLGPCPWGMFRTKSIPTMTPEEVYLGGIWGLSTNNIPFWLQNKDETMAGNGFGINDDKLIYELIMQQYRRHLRSNFYELSSQAELWLYEQGLHQ